MIKINKTIMLSVDIFLADNHVAVIKCYLKQSIKDQKVLTIIKIRIKRT